MMESEYREEDFLQLSGLQHFTFCRRQWALIHIEQQWEENVLTVKGNLFHEKVHDGYSAEKRKNIIISRGMPVHSRTLGISGECDVVEFVRAEEGIALPGREGRYILYPIEYKRGRGQNAADSPDNLPGRDVCDRDPPGISVLRGDPQAGMCGDHGSFAQGVRTIASGDASALCEGIYSQGEKV